MAAIGNCWAQGSWTTSAWAAGSWQNNFTESDAVKTYPVLRVTRTVRARSGSRTLTATKRTGVKVQR